MKRALCASVLMLVIPGCGANPYGYARYYEPLDDEEFFARQAVEPPYTEVVRDPGSFADVLIGWFGVVREVIPQEDRSILVRMSQRPHVERHLCAERSESSCRVTVSERDAGSFSVRLRLPPGAESQRVPRIRRDSLLKIYGRPTGEYDTTGGPFLSVEYYRHWPRGQYVDTTARSLMRR